MLRKNWWKILSVILLLYTFIAGFLGDVPVKPILNETIRNFYFHVAMWFGMMVFFIVSVVYSVKYLRNNRPFDTYAIGICRIGNRVWCSRAITGSFWAQYTWGAFWSNDPKQFGAAIALLIYLAYFVLRNSMNDMDKRRGSVQYTIFSHSPCCSRQYGSSRGWWKACIPAVWETRPLIPRISTFACGLFSGSVPFPGWTLLGVWITTLRIRLQIS